MAGRPVRPDPALGVVYYLDRADLERLASRVQTCATSGCDIVMVHWLGETHYPLTGDEAAGQMIAALSPTASVTYQARTEAYRLDILRVST